MRIVKNGDVHVSAPIGMPKKEVERFIEEHRDWMSICFSAYVLLLPEWCVEHVVVHELCHLLEPSHNARFHALMDKFFPRWKEARKETRQICKMEDEDFGGSEWAADSDSSVSDFLRLSCKLKQ